MIEADIIIKANGKELKIHTSITDIETPRGGIEKVEAVADRLKLAAQFMPEECKKLDG